MANLKFKVVLLFASVVELRATVREYAIKFGKNMKFIKNKNDRVRIVCSIRSPWVVYATQLRDEKTFQVKTYNVEHTCGMAFETDNLTSRYLCNKYVEHFKNSVKLSIRTFMKIVRNSLICKVSPSQAYRTKKKTLKQIKEMYIVHMLSF